ncbi:translation initiation factor [Candidatus Woesearchaeota archaeon]|nr:translation initiation factor [Candidatus Woesearchaeota archaeon]MBW3018214.1 translation initiation factor [Candidatus Woesearchaeota archaeon]
MSNICSKCGLPKELCVCETIAKESQKVVLKTEKRKFGKMYTLITGIDTTEIDIDDLTKILKSKLACGGTVKGNTIELQGNHLKSAKQILVSQGFAPETIEIR